MILLTHSDTSATGTELNTLTDNSIANVLHRHSELVASDGAPDPALSVDSLGRVGIGTTSPDSILELEGSSPVLHIDGLSNAYIRLDKGAATDRAEIQFREGTITKKIIGLMDSSYGTANDFLLAQLQEEIMLNLC